MMCSWRSLLILSLCWSGMSCLSPGRYLSPKDLDHMSQEVFGSVLSSDLSGITRQSLHYAVAGSKLLGKLPIDSSQLCSAIGSKISSAKEVWHLYDLAVPSSLLSCSLSAEQLAEAKKILTEADLSTPANIFHGYFAAKHLGLPLPLSGDALEKALSGGIKADNNLINLGYAFHLAGDENALPKKFLPAYYAWIEDAVAQADEVDGKYLQFEGGLSSTNFVLSGIFKLSARAQKNPPLTEAQLLKFTQYFLNRKSVQSVKGAYNLLEGVTQLSKNKFFEPVAVTLASTGVISDDSPKIRIRVSDLFGHALSGKFDVTIESATPKDPKGTALLKGTKMAPVAGEASLFEVDMKSLKPTRGFYTLVVNVNGGGADAGKKYIGLKGVSFPIKVSSVLAIEKFSYSIGDADQSTASTKNALKHPNKLPSALKLESRSKLSLKFTLKDKETSGGLQAHQVFLRIFNDKSEIIYLAEPEGGETSSTYKFEFNVGAKASDFKEVSGRYGIELILGDVLISNPTIWSLGDLDITFPASGSVPAEEKSAKGPLPEIKHLFRQPEKRPPSIVSNAFMILCVAPILIMFIAWGKIGVNVSGFPCSLASIGFHLGLGAIFLLYFYFWLQLNMFTTVKYLIVIGLFTFVCGNSMLAQIAKKKKV